MKFTPSRWEAVTPLGRCPTKPSRFGPTLLVFGILFTAFAPFAAIDAACAQTPAAAPATTSPAATPMAPATPAPAADAATPAPAAPAAMAPAATPAPAAPAATAPAATAAAAAPAAATPAPPPARDANHLTVCTPNSGDTAWMLASVALVLMMTIPGLGLF